MHCRRQHKQLALTAGCMRGEVGRAEFTGCQVRSQSPLVASSSHAPPLGYRNMSWLVLGMPSRPPPSEEEAGQGGTNKNVSQTRALLREPRTKGSYREMHGEVWTSYPPKRTPQPPPPHLQARRTSCRPRTPLSRSPNTPTTTTAPTGQANKLPTSHPPNPVPKHAKHPKHHHPAIKHTEPGRPSRRGSRERGGGQGVLDAAGGPGTKGHKRATQAR
jgi:hypothetical protein